MNIIDHEQLPGTTTIDGYWFLTSVSVGYSTFIEHRRYNVGAFRENRQGTGIVNRSQQHVHQLLYLIIMY